MTPSDSVVRLAAARAGEATALSDLLETCRAYLLTVARQELPPRLQGKGGASDLVQETFLEAQRDFAQFKGDSEDELRAWLRRLLLNNIANFTRQFRTVKRSVDREVSLDAEPLLKEDLAARIGPDPLSGEQAEALERAILLLPEDHRQVILLRHRDECSFDEIAQRMERSVNAVRKLWGRALENLRDRMDTT
jgi:RNA polymerase sigma-70 factor (ECF subfamily)